MCMSMDFLPVVPSPKTKEEVNLMSASSLAFIGDAVQTLYVRTALATVHDAKTAVLHKLVAQRVNAVRQAEAITSLLESLTEEETDIFKRVRNSKTNTIPKHATVGDYKLATGFEGLIGYLYLLGRHERLNLLLEMAYGKEE